MFIKILFCAPGLAGSLQGLEVRRASDGGANINLCSHQFERQVHSQPGSTENHNIPVSVSVSCTRVDILARHTSPMSPGSTENHNVSVSASGS